MKHAFILTAGLCLLHCAPVTKSAEPADLIYYNGTLLTMDDSRPTAEAVAVRDSKISAVGTEAEVLKTSGENTTKIDLGGKAMLPGFVDSHGHTYLVGLQATTANQR